MTPQLHQASAPGSVVEEVSVPLVARGLFPAYRTVVCERRRRTAPIEASPGMLRAARRRLTSALVRHHPLGMPGRRPWSDPFAVAVLAVVGGLKYGLLQKTLPRGFEGAFRDQNRTNKAQGAEGGIRIFSCRMLSPAIGSEIKIRTSVRPWLHVFAASWFQNWFQATRSQCAVCGMK